MRLVIQRRLETPAITRKHYYYVSLCATFGSLFLNISELRTHTKQNPPIRNWQSLSMALKTSSLHGIRRFITVFTTAPVYLVGSQFNGHHTLTTALL
jgi:hypothetical protein